MTPYFVSTSWGEKKEAELKGIAATYRSHTLDSHFTWRPWKHFYSSCLFLEVPLCGDLRSLIMFGTPLKYIQVLGREGSRWSACHASMRIGTHGEKNQTRWYMIGLPVLRRDTGTHWLARPASLTRPGRSGNKSRRLMMNSIQDWPLISTYLCTYMHHMNMDPHVHMLVILTWNGRRWCATEWSVLN